MSLVDYPSDEDDEHAVAEEKPDDDEDDIERHFALHQEAIHSSNDGASASSSTTLVANAQHTQSGANASHTSIGVENVNLRLPDAAELLASLDATQNTSISNITSVPSIATGASVSRKRADMNGSLNAPQRKILRGNLPPSRVIPDTAGGSLLPPQLRGRSNVTTEDLEKLFTRRPRSKP